MTITFNSIPTTLRTPGQYVEVSSERAVSGTPEIPHKALAIGMRLAAGTVAASIPTLVPSADDADLFFGRGSQLASMCRVFKELNSETELWAIGVAETGGGTAAQETITITGPATAAGTLCIYIEGRRIEITITNGEGVNDIADAIYAAILLEDDLMFTAASPPAGVITLTCRHKGILGNLVNWQHSLLPGESLPAGVGCAFAATVPGVTDTAITAAIAAMGDIHYNTIIMGFSEDSQMDLIEAELETRWGPLAQKEGIAFGAYVGTQGNATTYGNARNSKHSCVMAAGKSPAPPWLWAAAVAAMDAKETDPARPRQTLALTPAGDRYFAPGADDIFTQTERGVLLTDGMSTYTVDNAGIVRIERLITTYQTNAAAVPDTSYLDLTTMRTLAYLRYSQNTRIGLRFPRHKLADDGTRFSPGQAVTTPALIRAELLALFVEWEEDGLVEGWEQFKDDLLVERNATDRNRVDVRMSPDLMNAFMVFAGQVQFIV